ncbi:MAG: hypothetical protein KGK07_14475 [Chloroflexota bacterium]|nr:hypothetical protein [Chloroflexota bacterium]
MSEPLPRETCQALARAYASEWEERRRAARLDDAFWVRRDGQVDRYAAKDWSVVVVFWCGEPAPIAGWPDVAVWAPRLGDLLDLAKSLCIGSESPDLWWGDSYDIESDGSAPNCWRFSAEPDPGEQFRTGTTGATPSAAVAAWLLARKDGGA